MAESKLSLLRKILKEEGVDAFIVGSGDAHQSEYVSNADLRRGFISDFTGSAGTAVILQDKALLWTDGRYFLQAENELSSEWTLMKSGQPNVPELKEWVMENMTSGNVVGVDSLLMSIGEAKTLIKSFEGKGITLKGLTKNPVDTVWSQCGRPAQPTNPLRAMDLSRTGLSHETKIKNIQAFLEANNASAMLVCPLDDVAWLLNFRGNDVECNPVALSYAIVTMEKTLLFVDVNKVTEDVGTHFGPNVIIKPYEEVADFLSEQAKKGRVIMDPAQVNWRLYDCAGDAVLEKTSPIVLAKSIKNAVELEGFRQAHIRDGAALTAFFHWLETTIQQSDKPITEWDITERVEEFRGKMKDHMGPSFGTIAAYGSNGAMMHYSPSKETSAVVGRESTYLQDSGAQYLDGTTDVTRTMHFGTPSEKIKHCYTAVLKGHITLARAVFPEGTLGSRIDSLARLALWEQGLDYNHGTGHGVGSYLNVHEGPQGISFRKKANEVGYYAGMTTSNEPGYYEDGHFGIRIENLCITVPKPTPFNFMDKKYIGFETVTMSPIALNMVNIEQLNADEIRWLNDYHATVREKLTPYVQDLFPQAMEYLIQKTNPIEG
mmetsp:Transcript_24802/g.41323  ORF Transcript_24802/g.41323 Transcript_24802/m.41323 type:complete len:603 (+) Transcript_24802:36-1844(+)|eukprot:CAMPEP_0174968134 /NCGR_PEP_ID=MMETSP0004_2-20121128/7958_1 /TAXON_ID=420556 /ORGANISM="Ochromonas sp., Strain CCMP1393" /LENGTH=602 /DNA_ID=CAMNT_0016217319 /DNA_START=36 /DNA_END=1844 /DNA_ORIENTATION=+